MREPIRDPGRLQHILNAIDKALEYTNGLTFEDIVQNSMVCHATTYNLQIIGEAVYKLSNEFKQSHPNTPWNDIAGFRHVLVHDYYTIDLSVLWNVVTNDLNPLKMQILQYVDELNDSQLHTTISNS